MNNLEREIDKLESDKQQLQDQITLLKRDNQALIKDKKTLKALLKENKLLIDDFTRQGFRYDQSNSDWGWHYIVIPIKGIPLSLNIIDVKELIDEALKDHLSTDSIYADYKISHFDYSERKNIWYVQIEKLIDTKSQ